MPHPSFPNLTVLEHPLIQHKLSILRDKSTPVKDFKQLVSEIAMLMTYEVTRDLETEEVMIDTPLEQMKARRVAGKKLSLVPIPVSYTHLRAHETPEHLVCRLLL